MAFENRIMAVINPASKQQVALEKAVGIAQITGGEVTALIRKEHASDELLESIDNRLSQAAVTGLITRLDISEERTLFRSIARCQDKHRIELIIKQPNSAHAIDSIFVPDDWKILRNARCPVLMVRDGDRWSGRPILMAVDMTPSDNEHARLNERILKAGQKIQPYANSPLHLVTAYPSEMQDAYDPALQSESAQFKRYEAQSRRMVAELGISLEGIHIEPGPAELIIPEKAKSIGAKLVILGTVARSGLQGVLLGNTAEQLLPRLDANLLVLPPA